MYRPNSISFVKCLCIDFVFGGNFVVEHVPHEHTTALVLDANQRSALALARSLGRAGVAVYCADNSQSSLAGSSSTSFQHIGIPSPKDSPYSFTKTVEKIASDIGAAVVFPMTEVSSRTLLTESPENLLRLLPFSKIQTVDAIADKQELLRLAGQLNIPYPESRLLVRGSEVMSIGVTTFPVVLKPTRSHYLVDGKWLNSSVRVAHSVAELTRIVSSDPVLADHPMIVQDFISGYGAGISALYNQGTPVAFFAHRRLREKPPTGGVSVFSESVALDGAMLVRTKKLLGSVNWHGVAMVEYRVTPEGEPYLMEVNTRFWGSLQLAIDSGVDFPWLLWQIATEQEPSTISDYAIGCRLRWLLGDIDSLYLVLKDPQRTRMQKLQRIVAFLRPDFRHTRHEVNRWKDLRPAWFEFKQYLRALRQR